MNHVGLINEVGDELRMGAQQSAMMKKVKPAAKPPRPNYLKVLPLRTCGHCVDCCCPPPPTGEVSLAYMKTFVHHSLPNTPANMAVPRISRKYLLSSSLMPDSRKATRHDYVDSNPSRLRRRRHLPFLTFLDLPQTYTNVPDFYSELLVIQYEMKKQEVFNLSPVSSSCGKKMEKSYKGSQMEIGKEYTSSFKLNKETAVAATGGALKRPYKEIMRESCYQYERQDSVISSSSALSSEFSFDGLDDTIQQAAECNAARADHIGRFRVQYQELGMKRKFFQSIFESVSNGSARAAISHDPLR